MKNLISILSALLLTSATFADGDCLAKRSLSLPAINLGNINNVLSSMSSDGQIAGILGEDDRETIYEPDKNELTEDLLIGRLQISSLDGSVKSCSGTLVGKNLVLTAAHCFYNGVDNTLTAGKVTFTLQQSDKYKPFGDTIAEKVLLPKDFFLDVSETPGTVSLSQRENDYALIVLNEDIGEEFGWHSMSLRTNDEEDIVIASYPSDKKRQLTYEECTAIKPYYSKAIYEFDCDIVKGASGSALIDDDNIVLGVVSSSGTYSNKATKFTPRSFEILRNWTQGNISEENTYEVQLSQEDNFKIVFKNKCNKTIHIAYKVEKSNGFEKGGLYILKSGEEMSVSNIVSKDFYFYGKIAGTNSEWRGDSEIYLDDYKRSYSFIRKSIDSTDIGTVHNQSFSCN